MFPERRTSPIWAYGLRIEWPHVACDTVAEGARKHLPKGSPGCKLVGPATTPRIRSVYHKCLELIKHTTILKTRLAKKSVIDLAGQVVCICSACTLLRKLTSSSCFWGLPAAPVSIARMYVHIYIYKHMHTYMYVYVCM